MSESPFPFRWLEPLFVSGLMDDPSLLFRLKRTNQIWMVDAGQSHFLAMRLLTSISHIFITHAHMDHLMGLDRVVRSQLVTSRTLRIFGPPRLAERVFHLMQAYEWNLVEDYYCSLHVTEIHPDHFAEFLLPGALGFPLQPLGTKPREGLGVFHEQGVLVQAELFDHKLASVAYRFVEDRPFSLKMEAVHTMGLTPGPWIGELKEAFQTGQPLENHLWVDSPQGPLSMSLQELSPLLDQEQPQYSLGVLMDSAASLENFAKAQTLLQGVTLLQMECSYTTEHQGKARANAHLCAADVNQILGALRPQFVVPTHFSKCYLKEPQQVYEDLRLPPETLLVRLPTRITPEPARWQELQGRYRLQHAGKRRLFIALELPPALLDYLDAKAKEYQRLHPIHGRWMARESLHLTLVFLGETSESQFEALLKNLPQLQPPVLEGSIVRLGPFPSLGRPRLIAAELEASPELRAWHTRLTQLCQDLGFHPEERAFRPHISLGRLKECPHPLADFPLHKQVAFATTLLLESHLTQEGAHYQSHLSLNHTPG